MPWDLSGVLGTAKRGRGSKTRSRNTANGSRKRERTAWGWQWGGLGGLWGLLRQEQDEEEATREQPRGTARREHQAAAIF